MLVKFAQVSKFFQVHVLQSSMGGYITVLMCQEVDDTLIEPECMYVTEQGIDYMPSDFENLPGAIKQVKTAYL